MDEIKDLNLTNIGTVEQLSNDIITYLSEIFSPSYIFTDNAQPTMSGKRRSIFDPKQTSLMTATTGDLRYNKLLIEIDKWKLKLQQLREKFESNEHYQSSRYQDLLSSYILNKKSVVLEKPDIKILKSLQVKPKEEGRILSCYDLFKSIIKTMDDLTSKEWLYANSIITSQKIALEVAFKGIRRNILVNTSTLSRYYEENLTGLAKKFKLYVNKENALAMKKQQELYNTMLALVERQHEIFTYLHDLLEKELDQILHQHEKEKLIKRLDQLKRKNLAFINEAKLFFKTSRMFVMTQPYSTILFKNLQTWLFEYQKVLLEALSLIVLKEDEHKLITPSLGKTMIDKSPLFRYAKNFSTTQLVDMNESKKLNHELILRFSEHLLRHNETSLNNLKVTTEKLTGEYTKLQNVFKKQKKIQEFFYRKEDKKSEKKQRLPSIEDAKDKLKDPAVIKDLIRLNAEIKVHESNLQLMSDELEKKRGVELAYYEQANKNINVILEQLKQFNVTMKKWEENIHEEIKFVEYWKELRRAQTKYILELFKEWDLNATQEFDDFKSVALFYLTEQLAIITESFNGFFVQSLTSWSKASDGIEEKMRLCTSLYNDVRQGDLSASDVLIQVQSKIQQWVELNKEVYQVYFHHLFGQVAIYFIMLLEDMLESLVTDDALKKYLSTIDTLFDNYLN